MTKDEIILKDLTRHLRDRVCDVIGDYVGNCSTADIEYRDVATELMMFFTHLAASYAASQFDIDAKDFAMAMRLQFEQAQRRIADDSF